jgi:hypothetical protein
LVGAYAWRRVGGGGVACTTAIHAWAFAYMRPALHPFPNLLHPTALCHASPAPLSPLSVQTTTAWACPSWSSRSAPSPTRPSSAAPAAPARPAPGARASATRAAPPSSTPAARCVVRMWLHDSCVYMYVYVNMPTRSHTTGSVRARPVPPPLLTEPAGAGPPAAAAAAGAEAVALVSELPRGEHVAGRQGERRAQGQRQRGRAAPGVQGRQGPGSGAAGGA